MIDTDNKEIYIGSAKRLGDRVVEGRKEIPGWNRFKYELIHPQYHHLLRRIEHHSIRAFASFLENRANEPFHKISSYTLVNKAWSKRR